MDTNTLLLIIVVILLLGGGGFFFRRRYSQLIASLGEVLHHEGIPPVLGFLTGRSRIARERRACLR